MNPIRPRWLCAAGFALFLFGGCYYDANPPSQDRLDQYRPFLALRVTGLADDDRLLFRWREDGGSWQNFTAPLFVTPGGELYFSHLFSINVSQIEIELIIDEDKNNQVDGGEPVYTSPVLNFSTTEDRAALTLERSDFTP